MQHGGNVCANRGDLAKYGAPKHPREIVDENMPIVGYFSANTGLLQPLEFCRGDEKFTLERARNDVLVSESNARVATALAGLGIVVRLTSWCAHPSSRGN